LVGEQRVRVGSLRFLNEPPPFEALEQTSVWVEVDGSIVAQLTFTDPIRPNARQLIDELHGLGRRVVLISGDRRASAEAVARELGIDEVIAEVLPSEKAQAVERLRQQYRGPVMFVGDGLNDAPALARADVGVAMGSGTDLAVQSADVVLLNNDLLAISRAVRLSVLTMRNIRQNLFWAFAYNAALIPVAAGAFGLSLSPVLAGAAMACSSLLVVGNALRLRWAR
jgi:P-type Cu+ transporter